MYIIIEYNARVQDAWIMLDEDGDEAAGNVVFDSKEAAQAYADINCAFRYTIVKIGE